MSSTRQICENEDSVIKIPWLWRTPLHPKESYVSRQLVGYLSDTDVFKDLSQQEMEALFEGMLA